MRPGCEHFFLLRRMLTPPERLLSSLSASPLSLSRLSVVFLCITHATAPRNCYRYKFPFLPIG